MCVRSYVYRYTMYVRSCLCVPVHYVCAVMRVRVLCAVIRIGGEKAPLKQRNDETSEGAGLGLNNAVRPEKRQSVIQNVYRYTTVV